MTEYFEIGKIVNTQGVKGEVRIIPSTFDINRFKLLERAELRRNGKPETKSLEIESVRYHKHFVIMKFKGIDDMNEGERLKGYTLIVSRENALPLEEDEFYTADLYGMEVVTDQGEFLGNISDIIETGANDVYVIELKGRKDILIPAIKQCILWVDIENKKMTVRLMEGLV